MSERHVNPTSLNERTGIRLQSVGRITGWLCAALLLGGCAAVTMNACREPAPAEAPGSAAELADTALHAVHEREWALHLARVGRKVRDGRTVAGAHLPDVGAASQAQRLQHWQAVQEELARIPRDALSTDERINAAVFDAWLATRITQLLHRTYEAPFEGVFWNYLSVSEPFPDAAGYRDYLGRMADIPRHFAQQIDNMRAGLRRGFTAPRVVIRPYVDGIDGFLRPGEQNPFFEAFVSMPRSIPEASRNALRAQALQLIDDAVVPAYAELRVFMREEYLPGARATTDAHSLPDGRRFYRDRIREFTTTPLEADQIHAIGLQEVARIGREMQQAMRATGFHGDMDAFLRFLRTDPQFQARTPRELLSHAAWVAKKMDGQLRHQFATLPRSRFSIQPVPEAIAPNYAAGAGGLDACLINTHDLASRPVYALTALTLHECSPGHSLQMAVAHEQPGLAAFRRDMYFSATSEGWALYAEWLGSQLGLYETPYEEFGRLSYEMLRAARLVVDTGIHAKGWSRQRAIDYLLEHSAMTAADAAFEIDRYILWPGQALAYKIGELRIRALRAQAEERLGECFDPRLFHDRILQIGSVPLDVLEREMERGLAARSCPSAEDEF